MSKRVPRMPKLGGREVERITFCKPGLVIVGPDAPWIECSITDISASGVWPVPIKTLGLVD